jgi:hypothetical protein
MKKILTLCFLVMLVHPAFTNSVEKIVPLIISWTGVEEMQFNGSTIKTPGFIGAVNDDGFGILPVFTERFQIQNPGTTFDFQIEDAIYQPFEDQSLFDNLADRDLIAFDIQSKTELAVNRLVNYCVFKMLPIRLNLQTGNYEKLLSFNLHINEIQDNNNLKNTRHARDFAASSVLAQGDWFKFAVVESGVYKLTYQQLKDLGMDADALDPTTLQIYGNGAGMLPEKNADYRHDDLRENAIVVEDGKDGSFDEGDFILFYGESQSSWNFVPLKLAFTHTPNLYSDSTFYFITSGQHVGKRVSMIAQSQSPVTKSITTFADYDFYENDSRNLIKSGAEWYGEEFLDVLSRDFQFNFPNIVQDYSSYFAVEVAARSAVISSFVIDINEDSMTVARVPAVVLSSPVYFANSLLKTFRFNSPTDQINVNLTYLLPDNNSTGWLNYIEVNVMRHLIFTSSQMDFRDFSNVGAGNVTEFVISQAPAQLTVWDITNSTEPGEIDITNTSETIRFALETDTLRQFIGFDGQEFLSPELIGKIDNQNLHANFETYDFIIIAPEIFMEQAVRLKELHEEMDGMKVIIAEPHQIFNEFSSGSPDPVAIREYAKMLYERSGSTPQLKYLLLFGDGSYDPKNRLDENKNFVLTYQSKQSLKPTSSYVTDDFFGLMDDNEGVDASGDVDLGIGRFPVNTLQEAKDVVDKIEHYMRFSSNVQGSWRNDFCFMADDEDYNLHFYQADTILVKDVSRRNKTININKIYLDSFKQETTSNGYTYPEANIALNKQINDGALFMNYTGHGGELGWTIERVLQISDINSWTNFDKLPVFITATCEFSRFDNPHLTSAGELVLLSPTGGGIALFTTTRLAFAGVNLTLNKRLYDTLFLSTPGNYPRLGDMIRFAKTPSNTNTKNFHLLGDPALNIAFPRYNIITDSINGNAASNTHDTIFANSTVRISGHISNLNEEGSVVSGFNGEITPVLFDKEVTLMTLGNDPKSFPESFKIQNRRLYEGKVSVVNGKFEFTFIVPKDISYEFGPGKISYYASDSTSDAAGYYDSFIIGGYDETAENDQIGPDIYLYLNDSLFVNGSTIYNNPVMYAHLSDQQGINASGSGIGHDIVAVLDGNTNQSIILNNSFVPDINSYQSGTVMLPLQNLSLGRHTLQLKAWDMFNNSSSKTIEFIVSDSIVMDLTEVRNYPNPFNDYTLFSFKHNQYGTELNVQIEIFNFGGQMVRLIGPIKVSTSGYYVDPLWWDGTDEGGSKLRPGFYFYKLKAENEQGSNAERIQKMIISK